MPTAASAFRPADTDGFILIVRSPLQTPPMVISATIDRAGVSHHPDFPDQLLPPLLAVDAWWASIGTDVPYASRQADVAAIADALQNSHTETPWLRIAEGAIRATVLTADDPAVKALIALPRINIRSGEAAWWQGFSIDFDSLESIWMEYATGARRAWLYADCDTALAHITPEMARLRAMYEALVLAMVARGDGRDDWTSHHFNIAATALGWHRNGRRSAASADGSANELLPLAVQRRLALDGASRRVPTASDPTIAGPSQPGPRFSDFAARVPPDLAAMAERLVSIDPRVIKRAAAHIRERVDPAAAPIRAAKAEDAALSAHEEAQAVSLAHRALTGALPL